MDKNTQQIPHSLSIEIQGQLLATLLTRGMYKQRQGNTHMHTHILTQTETDMHPVAPSGTSYRCPWGVWWTLCTFGINCRRCCFVCFRGAVFLSPTWHTDTDMLRHLCWEDNIMQYIAISRYCTVGNMTFQPSTLAVWLPVVCLPRYMATGCLPPHAAALSTSLCSNTCSKLLFSLWCSHMLFIRQPDIDETDISFYARLHWSLESRKCTEGFCCLCGCF